MSFFVDSFQCPVERGPVVMVHKGWQSSKKSITAGLTQRTDSKARKSGGIPKATSSQTFQFVNVTDATPRQNPKTRKLIKAYVVKDSARRKRVLAQLHGRLKSKLTDSSHSGISDSESTSTSDQLNRLTQSLDPHPHLSSTIHYINKVASAMYPLENKFKFNPLSAAPWFDFALSDEALFNAMLYTTAAYAGLLEGTTESKAAMMRMNQSVVLVNERLQVSQVDIKNGTIGAVSCLAITEVRFIALLY